MPPRRRACPHVRGRADQEKVIPEEDEAAENGDGDGDGADVDANAQEDAGAAESAGACGEQGWAGRDCSWQGCLSLTLTCLCCSGGSGRRSARVLLLQAGRPRVQGLSQARRQVRGVRGGARWLRSGERVTGVTGGAHPSAMRR
jgi:hypothetical protein